MKKGLLGVSAFSDCIHNIMCLKVFTFRRTDGLHKWHLPARPSIEPWSIPIKDGPGSNRRSAHCVIGFGRASMH